MNRVSEHNAAFQPSGRGAGPQAPLDVLPLPAQRLHAIHAELRRGGACRTRELADLLGTSEMTIRRDLQFLERQGLVRRVHGGAMMVHPDLPHDARRHHHEKTLIGRQAAQLVRPGMTVYLDTGTTSLEVAHAVLARRAELPRLRVVTHAVNVAAALVGQLDGRVHVIGGELDHHSLGASSPGALEQIARLDFDLFFLGVTGVHATRGFTNANEAEAAVKRAVAKRARCTYVVADHHKWNVLDPHALLALSDVTGWVTDDGVPHSARHTAKQVGLPLIVAHAKQEVGV